MTKLFRTKNFAVMLIWNFHDVIEQKFVYGLTLRIGTLIWRPWITRKAPPVSYYDLTDDRWITP